MQKTTMKVLLRVASCESKKHQRYIGPDKLKGPKRHRTEDIEVNFKAYMSYLVPYTWGPLSQL